MLGNLQERVERSIFEAIRKVLVQEGYLPDITNAVRYPSVNGNFTAQAQANWEADLATVKVNKGFAIEIFGYSASDQRGTKKVPRIVIESMRSMPSEIGAPMDGIILEDPLQPDASYRQPLPYMASNLQFDIHLVGNSAKQVRVLQSVLAKALGTVKYIPYYDEVPPPELFFLRQYNYFDVPDQTEGIEEKVYSYEAPDLFDVQEEPVALAKINEINVEVSVIDDVKTLDEQGNGGNQEPDATIHIDEDGTEFQ